tara:strand:- start:853 stop:1053 length:201 start_codon:yes stop_codon:yes gene_type:complete
MRRKKRPKTDLDPQFDEIANKMYLLEKENERLGKCIEVALEVLEFLWNKTKIRAIKTALRKMAKIR